MVARGGAPSPLSKWSLIRNQIAVARRRERIFAIQFFDGFSFMGWLAGEEDLGDFLAELFFG
jgi:hypothetical protein